MCFYRIDILKKQLYIKRVRISSAVPEASLLPSPRSQPLKGSQYSDFIPNGFILPSFEFYLYRIIQYMLLYLGFFFLYIYIYIYNFIYLLLAVLDLCCCMGSSLIAARRSYSALVAASGGYSLVVVCRLLIAVASLVAECKL